MDTQMSFNNNRKIASYRQYFCMGEKGKEIKKKASDVTMSRLFATTSQCPHDERTFVAHSCQTRPVG